LYTNFLRKELVIVLVVVNVVFIVVDVVGAAEGKEGAVGAGVAAIVRFRLAIVRITIRITKRSPRRGGLRIGAMLI